jgi:hypothetical protein
MSALFNCRGAPAPVVEGRTLLPPSFRDRLFQEPMTINGAG